MLSALVLMLVFSSVHFVRAENDWSKPCFQGVCTYDVSGSATRAAATLRIWGHANALSDITTAAGYEIVQCEPHLTTQVVELVCMHEDPSQVGCDHLDVGGAIGKVVRLPEDVSTSTCW